jgi:hypothetical protein
MLDYLQAEGTVARGAPVTTETIEQARAAAKYAPGRLGGQYLFFLQRYEYEKPYYIGARFVLPANGNAEPEGNWTPEGRAKIPPRPSTEFIAEVERLIVAGPVTPTPTATRTPPTSTRVLPTATPFPTLPPTKPPTPVPVMPVETFIPSPVPTETPAITPTFPPEPPFSSTAVPGEEPRPWVPQRDVPPAKP